MYVFFPSPQISFSVCINVGPPSGRHLPLSAEAKVKSPGVARFHYLSVYFSFSAQPYSARSKKKKKILVTRGWAWPRWPLPSTCQATTLPYHSPQNPRRSILLLVSLFLYLLSDDIQPTQWANTSYFRVPRFFNLSRHSRLFTSTFNPSVPSLSDFYHHCVSHHNPR